MDQTPFAFAPFFGGFVLETLGMHGEARNAIRECIRNSLTAVAMDDEISILPLIGTVGDDGGRQVEEAAGAGEDAGDQGGGGCV